MGTVELENFTELSMKWVQAPSNITTTTKNWGTFLYKEIGSVNDDFYILLPDHASCSSFRSVVHPVAPGVCGAPAICGRCVRRCTTPSRSVWFARARAKVWGGEVGVWIVCSWAPSTSGKGVGSPSGTRVAQIDHHTSSYILIHNTFSGSTWSRKFHGRHSVVALHSKAAVVPEWSLVLVLVASKTEFKPPIRIQIRRATVYIGVSKRLEIQKHRPGNIESYPSHSMQYFQSIRFLKVYICDIPQKRPKPDAPPKKNMYL